MNRWTLKRQERAEADMAGLSAHAAPGSAGADRRDILKLIREAVELLDRVISREWTETDQVERDIAAFLARWRGKP